MNPASDTLTSATAVGSNLYCRAERMLLPGLGLGIAGDFLLREGPHGIGLFTWLLLLAGTALWLTRAAGPTRRRTLATWSTLAVLAAAFTALRELEAIMPLMLLTILLCALLTALETAGFALRAARVRDYFFTGFSFPLYMLTWTPRILKLADMSSVTRNRKLPGFVRGVVLALPLLVVFSALFAAADAGFTRYASALTSMVSERFLQHVLLTAIFGWIGLSLLGVACRQPTETTSEALPAPKFSLGPTEMHVVLALLSALFVAFVLLQLGYLFGGTEIIVNTSGLTVADYARRGFFELVVVAALTLGVLLAVDATDCDRGVLRRYGSVLIVCVLIILASALQRLFLYTDAFGMTAERFCALAVMLWQAFNLVAFAFTVLRERAAGFASMLTISAACSLLLLALVNPGALIARINLERALDGRELDTSYLILLGADAVPPILERFDALNARQQCQLARGLLFAYTLNARPERDWRYWNAARANANQAVSARADALYAAAGVANRSELADVPLFEDTCPQ